METNPQKVTYFAKADSRGKERKFGIKNIDRMRHMYIIGKTGMGKSTLLENMAAQDIQSGEGMAFIDPHGSAVETLLEYVPKERIDDVIYFAPFDTDYPISFNIMEDVGYDKRHLVVSGLMGAFKKIWKDQWSSRMEYILSNTLLALIEYPDATLLDVNTMLVDKVFRKKVIKHITDPIVKSFWVDEFANFSDRYTQEATPAIQNKIGQFVSNPIIRNIVGQPKASFSFREAMDEGKIVIMNLSKGRMGEQNADLIGSMLVVKIYLDAMSRADLPPAELKKARPFYFYVDEFQSFANDTFANILSESRKYNLSLTVAHQYIEQMPDEVRSAVFGNVGTMILFRVGAIDADVLEKELSPTFVAEDIVNLGFIQIYLKLMIDGLTSQPFSATTLPPLELPETSYVQEVIAASRRQYGKSREEVERIIIEHKEEGQRPEPKEEKEGDPPSPRLRRDEGEKKPQREGGFKSRQDGDRPRGDRAPRQGGFQPRDEGGRSSRPQERQSYRDDRGPASRGDYEQRPPRRDARDDRQEHPPREYREERPAPRERSQPQERRDNRPSRQAPKKEDTHQPFKDLIATIQQDQNKQAEPPKEEKTAPQTHERAAAPQPPFPNKPKGVSLKELNPAREKDATPNSKNMGALKDVLGQAIREDVVEKNKQEQQPPRPPLPRRSESDGGHERSSHAPQDSIPEVPEEVLRKVLNGEKSDE